MVCTLQEVQAQFEARNARERVGLLMEGRALRALMEMQVAQRPHVKLPKTGLAETSQQTFTDAELVRAMRMFNDDIRKVASQFNVSKGCIYNRLRCLPPGAIDGFESRIGSWSEPAPAALPAEAASAPVATVPTVNAPAPAGPMWKKINGKWRRE